jgi:hypothetical protein
MGDPIIGYCPDCPLPKKMDVPAGNLGLEIMVINVESTMMFVEPPVIQRCLHGKS